RCRIKPRSFVRVDVNWKWLSWRWRREARFQRRRRLTEVFKPIGVVVEHLVVKRPKRGDVENGFNRARPDTHFALHGFYLLDKVIAKCHPTVTSPFDAVGCS